MKRSYPIRKRVASFCHKTNSMQYAYCIGGVNRNGAHFFVFVQLWSVHYERQPAHFIFELPHTWLLVARSSFLYNSNTVVLHSSHFIDPNVKHRVYASSILARYTIISGVYGLSPSRFPSSSVFC